MLIPPSKTICNVDDRPRDLVALPVWEWVMIFGIVLISAVIAHRIFKSRVYRFLSSATKFTNRAVKYSPHERVEMEVCDLCICMLTSAFIHATGNKFIVEITIVD
jgi:hypothetical protein